MKGTCCGCVFSPALGAQFPVDSVSFELGVVAVVGLKVFIKALMTAVLCADLSPCVINHVLGCLGLSALVATSGAFGYKLAPVGVSALPVALVPLVFCVALRSALGWSYSDSHFLHDISVWLISDNPNLTNNIFLRNPKVQNYPQADMCVPVGVTVAERV